MKPRDQSRHLSQREKLDNPTGCTTTKHQVGMPCFFFWDNYPDHPLHFTLWMTNCSTMYDLPLGASLVTPPSTPPEQSCIDVTRPLQDLAPGQGVQLDEIEGGNQGLKENPASFRNPDEGLPQVTVPLATASRYKRVFAEICVTAHRHFEILKGFTLQILMPCTNAEIFSW